MRLVLGGGVIQHRTWHACTRLMVNVYPKIWRGRNAALRLKLHGIAFYAQPHLGNLSDVITVSLPLALLLEWRETGA